MEHILSFGKDLVADGYKLVSLAAPVLSIFIALAKWQRWSVIEINFAEISWAWVFAPITVWLFIAYLRRWLKYQKLEKERDQLKEIKNYEATLDRLSEYFDDGNNNIFNRPVVNRAEYDKWKIDWRAWQDDVENFLEKEFSLAEKNMFKNMVLFKVRELGGLQDSNHPTEKNMIAHQLQTLRQVIVRHSDRVQKWRAENISV